MYRRKGEWVASYKDTWSIDYSLSPIILAFLKRFRSLTHKSCFGVPCMIAKDFDIPSDEDGNFDVNLGLVYWEYVLDCMIYAFDLSNEPDISKYNFHINMEKVGDPDPITNCQQMHLSVDNESESLRYDQDKEKWHLECKKGRELFARYYTNLWW